jgi:AAA domain/Primase C terminal 2 (PriCT-2)
MKPITQEMLESLVHKLQAGRLLPSAQNMPTNKLGIPGTPISTPIDDVTAALIGKPSSPAESPEELVKLNTALSFLSSDVGRGSGRFYDSSGKPIPDYWLAGIWSLASLNWSSGKDIARSWSQLSNRYTDDGFEKAWHSYSPVHTNGIGIGSLYKRAKELGWNQTIVTSSIESTTQRFTLLGINDLAALSPTEYLVKGILPSSGLAAIYGPSGSGKTFLALDLIMAIACQSDWFGHKVKNAPVTYVGLEGKGGINNRIQAWCIKNPTLTPANFKIILDNFDLLNKANVVELAQAIIAAKMHQGVIVIDTLNQASPAADENSSHELT